VGEYEREREREREGGGGGGGSMCMIVGKRGVPIAAPQCRIATVTVLILPCLELILCPSIKVFLPPDSYQLLFSPRIWLSISISHNYKH
jgi:hypothetical protein